MQSWFMQFSRGSEIDTKSDSVQKLILGYVRHTIMRLIYLFLYYKKSDVWNGWNSLNVK